MHTYRKQEHPTANQTLCKCGAYDPRLGPDCALARLKDSSPHSVRSSLLQTVWAVCTHTTRECMHPNGVRVCAPYGLTKKHSAGCVTSQAGNATAAQAPRTAGDCRQWCSAAVPGIQCSSEDEARPSKSSPRSQKPTKQEPSHIPGMQGPMQAAPRHRKATSRLADTPPIEVSCEQPSSHTQPQLRACSCGCRDRTEPKGGAAEPMRVSPGRTTQLRWSKTQPCGSLDSAMPHSTAQITQQMTHSMAQRKCSATRSQTVAHSTATTTPSKARQSVLYW